MYNAAFSDEFGLLDKVLCSKSYQSDQPERSPVDWRAAGSLQRKAATAQPEEHGSTSTLGQSSAWSAVCRVSAHTVR